MPGHEATPITDDKQDLYQLQLPEVSCDYHMMSCDFII